jgi:F420-dependent oxidoreductase-like protein
MRLGANVSPFNAATVATEAERLGYTTALAPEGLHDAISVLGFVAGQTERLKLISGVCQIPGRTPVLAAMTAATMNALSGGRFGLGIGISNTDSTQNWHGARFARPLARTREYVEVLRLALAGQEVRHPGEHYPLPLYPEGSKGFQMPPGNAGTPIYLAAVGPKNLELAGEVADGWIGVFCSPEQVADAVPRLRAGRERAGKSMDDFEILLTAPVAFGEDPVELAEPIKGYVGHFMSLGNRDDNIYYRLADSMGFGPEARVVQDRFQAGDRAGGAAAVPYEFVDGIALLGTQERVAKRMRAYADAGVTTLCIGSYARTPQAQIEMLQAAAAAHAAIG